MAIATAAQQQHMFNPSFCHILPFHSFTHYKNMNRSQNENQRKINSTCCSFCVMTSGRRESEINLIFFLSKVNWFRVVCVCIRISIANKIEMVVVVCAWNKPSEFNNMLVFLFAQNIFILLSGGNLTQLNRSEFQILRINFLFLYA